jgi:peptidoglycan/xylan/chitin deacetylase (PgdA/CDA1 family)
MRLADGYLPMRRKLKSAALKATYYSGVYRLLSRRYSGVGAIWAMHRVVYQKHDSLATNLTVTADFLEHVITYFKSRVDFVTIDEVHRRLTQDEPMPRPFLALTFDDGFRDTLQIALPILRRHGVPATVYVPSGAPDRQMDPWPWRLEQAICEASDLSLDLPALPRRLAVATLTEKRAAYGLLVRYIHENIPGRRHVSELLLPPSRVSNEALIASQFLSWEELEALAAEPLITIGGHSVTHASLRDLDEEAAITEIKAGRERLSARLDIVVAHFAYPYGASTNCDLREFNLASRAGYVTGVTARHGTLFHEHRHYLMCLPRLVLGGNHERRSSAILDLSGASVALGPRWRRPIVTV